MNPMRRQFLHFAALAGCGLLLPGCTSKQGPLKNITFTPEDYRRLPVLGLATTLTEELSYSPRIEGKLPPGLQGVLFRNGPGRFDLNGQRKRCLLDGDGMVQSFRFAEGKAYYRNRFVRTPKYIEESANGKYIYSTWSTQAPGGFWNSLGGSGFANQAGISVVVRNGQLYAFDEFHPPYELNPLNLETIGESWLGLAAGQTVFSAHSKIDPKTGDWVFFGLEFGRKIKLHLTVLGANGALKNHQIYELPRFAYVHDFFVTERHIILNLHPLDIAVWGFLLGLKSMTGSMRWAPEKGNLVLVFNREGNNPPVVLETEASWMWHSLNAYDDGSGAIVADFVGYRNPDHFLGDDPALFAIMEGRPGHYKYPGELRRYHIDLSTRRLQEEVLDPGNFDFPTVNPARLCYRHRYGYFARIQNNEGFFNGIARVDYENGKTEICNFGPGVYCSEPVFASMSGRSLLIEDSGWVLTEVYDSTTQKSFLAVLDACNLPSGPLAKIHLTHHVPLGFHGFWQPSA